MVVERRPWCFSDKNSINGNIIFCAKSAGLKSWFKNDSYASRGNKTRGMLAFKNTTSKALNRKCKANKGVLKLKTSTLMRGFIKRVERTRQVRLKFKSPIFESWVAKMARFEISANFNQALFYRKSLRAKRSSLGWKIIPNVIAWNESSRSDNKALVET